MSIALARRLRRDATGPERAMWTLIRESGWDFRRQVQLGPHDVDFADRGRKIVIEIDGDTHGSEAAIAKDAYRDEYLRSGGFIVRRFTNDEVLTNPEGVWTVVDGVLSVSRSTKNTPTPVPSPQGGGGPSQSIFATSPPKQRKPRQARSRTLKDPTVGSPSPLRGGDRGGGTL